jgi:transcriptional regulator with XRE-family HTH domain
VIASSQSASAPLAQWIRRQLANRDWTAADLARRTNIGTGRISLWLNGKSRPNTESCLRLADVFGVDQDLVLTLAGHREPAPEIPADSAKARIIALLQRVELTPAQEQGLEDMIRGWLDFARASAPQPNRDHDDA